MTRQNSHTPRRRPLSRREVVALGGAIGIAGVGSFALRRLQPVGTPVADSPVLQAAQAQVAPVAGNPDGGLSMLVFTDFNCPVCRRAHQSMLQAAEEDGDVCLRFLDWPIFGADSHAAAQTAIAADAQGLYLPVHNALMAGAGRADAPAAEKALLAAGGDLAQLRQTLAKDGARIEGQLSRNAVHAFGLGLGGTPGYLIGHLRLVGRTSRREFHRAFARARRL